MCGQLGYIYIFGWYILSIAELYRTCEIIFVFILFSCILFLCDTDKSLFIFRELSILSGLVYVSVNRNGFSVVFLMFYRFWAFWKDMWWHMAAWHEVDWSNVWGCAIGLCWTTTSVNDCSKFIRWIYIIFLLFVSNFMILEINKIIEQN